MINKTALLVLAAGTLIVGEGATAAYFVRHSQSLSRKLEAVEPGYKKSQAEFAEKLAKLTEDYRKVKEDRDNVLTQAKLLLQDKQKMKDIKVTYEGKGKEAEKLAADYAELQSQSQNKINQLQAEGARLAKERGEFKDAYEKARKDTAVKELTVRMQELERQKEDALQKVKRSEADIRNELNQTMATIQKENSETIDRMKRDWQEVRNSLSKTIASLEKENEIARNDLAKARAEIDRLQGLHKQAVALGQDKEASAAKAKEDAAVSKGDLNKTILSLQNERDAANNELARTRIEADKLKKLYNDAGALQGEKDNTINKIRRENEAAKDDLGKALASLQRDKDAVFNELTKARAENEKLKDALKGALGADREKEARISELKSDASSIRNELAKKMAPLEAERDAARSELNASRVETAKIKKSEFDAKVQVKELRKELSGAKTENARKLSELKDDYVRKMSVMKKDYDDAAKKNKALEHELRNIPARFAEIARQNKTLVKQTAEMHYNLGVFYTRNKEYDRAIREFEKVIEINPDDAYARFNLGYIYAEYLVDRKKAIENFRHYLHLAKSDDRDIDWVRNYLLTWETFEGKMPMR